MEKVVPLSCTNTLMRKIADELPADVIRQIYLFHHRKEKERDVDKHVCKRNVSFPEGFPVSFFSKMLID